MPKKPTRKGWKASSVKNTHIKSWRKRTELSMPEAAEELGIGTTTYQYYERGERSDKNRVVQKVKIPKMLAMACLAYEHLATDLFAKMGVTITRDDKK